MRFNDHPIASHDIERARELRKNATPYEKKLWAALRVISKQHNLRFRRQQPIPPFVVDFVCMQARLVIELDGYSHDTRQQQDVGRDEKLRQMGFKILRFSNEDVKRNVEGVVETVLGEASALVLNKRVEV